MPTITPEQLTSAHFLDLRTTAGRSKKHFEQVRLQPELFVEKLQRKSISTHPLNTTASVPLREADGCAPALNMEPADVLESDSCATALPILLLGMTLGLCAASSAYLMGVSFLWALGIYSAVGSTIALTCAVVVALLALTEEDD